MPIRYLVRRQPALFVQTVIILNVIVFLGWTFGGPFLPPNFMAENFLVSWTAVEQGRWWVLITSVFSHNMFFHLFINMFVLSSFGSVIELVFGRRRITHFYFLAGIMGSIAHIYASKYILGQADLQALGASGAVAGVILLFAMLFPKEKILLLGIIPIPAIWGAFLFIGIDLYGLYTQSTGGGLPIGHGAHLGGAFTGIGYYFWWRKHRNSR